MRLFLCTLGWVSSGSSGHFKEQSYYKRPHPCVINKPSTLHKAGTPALCPPPHHSQPPAGRGSGLSSPLSLLRGGHPNSTPGHRGTRTLQACFLGAAPSAQPPDSTCARQALSHPGLHFSRRKLYGEGRDGRWPGPSSAPGPREAASPRRS